MYLKVVLVSTCLLFALGVAFIRLNQGGQIASNRPVGVWHDRVLQNELAIGSTAPSFSLSTADGSGELSLSRILENRQPVVLVFGSRTCPYFRREAETLGQLVNKYADSAQFVFVYIREAHPVGEGVIPENINIEPIDSGRSIQARRIAAQTCSADMGLSMTLLVDKLDNSVAESYQAWPERAYVLNADGTLIHKSLRSSSFDCAEIDSVLLGLLDDHRS